MDQFICNLLESCEHVQQSWVKRAVCCMEAQGHATEHFYNLLLSEQ